jgi:hypothetical protein
MMMLIENKGNYPGLAEKQAGGNASALRWRQSRSVASRLPFVM